MTARAAQADFFMPVQRRLSMHLTLYIGRQVMIWVASVFLLFIVVIFLIDMIEMLRRAATKPEATFHIVVLMTALRLPFLALQE